VRVSLDLRGSEIETVGMGFSTPVSNPVAAVSAAPTNRVEAPPAGTIRQFGQRDAQGMQPRSYLNENFTFETFVEGKSNQLALAAACQVAVNPGGGYNPLFIYGGVGLGKTHLMQAVGNALKEANPGAKVLYLHSERFVADMVKALQLNAISEFKRYSFSPRRIDPRKSFSIPSIPCWNRGNK